MNNTRAYMILILTGAWVFVVANAPLGHAEELALFDTGFEPGEGFVVGDLDGQIGWIADTEFGDETVIADAAFNQGSQSLELVKAGGTGPLLRLGASSPVLNSDGPTRRVKLVYEAAVMISDAGAADSAVQVIDTVANLAAVVVLFSFTGDVYVDYFDTDTNWTAGQWMDLRVEVKLNQAGEPASADVFLDAAEIACDVDVIGLFDIDGLQFVGDGGGSSFFVDDLRARLVFTRGDFDDDGEIDVADFATFVQCFSFGSTTPPAACSESEFELTDLNGDGATDLFDFATFARNFGI